MENNNNDNNNEPNQVTGMYDGTQKFDQTPGIIKDMNNVNLPKTDESGNPLHFELQNPFVTQQGGQPMPQIPFLPPPPHTPRPPFAYMESCVMKAVTGAPIGWVLGGAFGVLIASWESMSPPVMMPNTPEPPGKPWKEEFRAAGRTMGRKCASWSKNFAIVTAVYQGVECSLERGRAKHDIWNHGVAGCGTGAVLAAKHGPQAALMGCAGFAAFSLAIESLMNKH